MLKNERQQKIIELLNKKAYRTEDLAKILKASCATIRRDLKDLASKGKIHKVFGGALNINYKTSEDSYDFKQEVNPKIKETIAKKAASLINDNDSIFLDAGTTTAYIIDYLGNTKAKFVTNSYIHAHNLSLKGYDVILIGGRLKNHTKAIIGSEAMYQLMNYNFTKSFIGCNGLSLKNGLTTADINEAKLKALVIKKSKETFVLADDSKFDIIYQNSFVNVGDVRIISNKQYANLKSMIII